MKPNKISLKTLFAEHKYNLTSQRQLIFSLLQGQEPLSMNELCERAKGQLDRSTVYRIIAVFEEIGIARRITIGWKYKIELSDSFSDHHHHLVCLKCQKVIPIQADQLEVFINDVATAHKFHTTQHQVELVGYCQACSL